jgi:hypothetical protein
MPIAVLAHAISEYLPQAGQTANAAGAGAAGGIIGDMFRQ